LKVYPGERIFGHGFPVKLPERDACDVQRRVENIVQGKERRNNQLIEKILKVFPVFQQAEFVKINHTDAEKKRPLELAVCAGAEPDGIDLEMDKFARKAGMRQKTEDEPKEEHDIRRVKIDPKEREKPRCQTDLRHKN